MQLENSAIHSVICRAQNTLANPVSFSGIGIHTGEVVSLRFCPADVGTGLLFKRIDLPGKPTIPATFEYICDTSRSTTLGLGSVRIHTVEHVLAALKAYRIDNLIIDVSSIEPPVGNGSSDVFVAMIEEAGVKPQDGEVPIIKLQTALYWSDGDIHIAAHPYDGYRISYTLSYPESKVLKNQFHTLLVSPEAFKKDIASCRTFSKYEEITYLMDKGLIKGGSLDNAVVIKGDAVLSKGGLFFPDEMVRHKILDMVGDLSLVGYDFHAHIFAYRSGHKTNAEFAKILYKTLTMENVK